MWEPRRLTTLWAYTACYRDSFTIIFVFNSRPTSILALIKVPLFVFMVSILAVTAAEQSKACTVFARSEAEIMGLNPTQCMDVWYVYVFNSVIVLSCL
jgi:hypothetical protein